PASFGKPATFGLSFGLTTITLAWVTGRPRVTGRTRWLLLCPLAVADTTEVAWVTVQRWRGVASHFNFATTVDAALFVVGGAAIAVTVTVIRAGLAAVVRRPGRAAAAGPGVGRHGGARGAGGGQRRADRRQPGALRPRRGRRPNPGRGGATGRRLRRRP